MPKQEKTPKKKSKKKTPQKSEESEYPVPVIMDQDEMNRVLQNAIEHAQAELQQKHEEHIKALEADREAKIKVVEPEDNNTWLMGAGATSRWSRRRRRRTFRGPGGRSSDTISIHGKLAPAFVP